MEFSLREITAEELNLSAAECEAKVWGHSNPPELLKQNKAFWQRQEDPLLLVALRGQVSVIGFRYAHALPPESSDRVLYDQNGGVAPEARRLGVGRALLREQHRLAKARGYSVVRTGVALPLKPMIILNLQEGFEITGLVWNAEHHVKQLDFAKRL